MTGISVLGMNLTAAECRVLGALIEKHLTTPDHYPLTTKALIAACNQSSNRDPVVSYDEDIVIDAVNGLRSADLGKTVRRHGERAMKHTEIADLTLSIDRRQKALLAVLLLRGPQTVGELRSRTERYCTFEDLDDVAATLEQLQKRDNPLVELMARRPGQKEARYRQLLSADEPGTSSPSPVSGQPTAVPTAAEAGAPTSRTAAELDDLHDEVEALRAELAELRRRIETLEAGNA